MNSDVAHNGYKEVKALFDKIRLRTAKMLFYSHHFKSNAGKTLWLFLNKVGQSVLEIKMLSKKTGP